MSRFLLRLFVLILGYGGAGMLVLKGHGWLGLTLALTVSLLVLRDWVTLGVTKLTRGVRVGSRPDVAAMVCIVVVGYSTWREWPELALVSIVLFFILFLRDHISAVVTESLSVTAHGMVPPAIVLAVLILGVVATALRLQWIAVVALCALLALLLARTLAKGESLRRDEEFLGTGGVRELPLQLVAVGNDAKNGVVQVVLEPGIEPRPKHRLSASAAWAEILLTGLSLDEVGLLLGAAYAGDVDVAEVAADTAAALRRRGLLKESRRAGGRRLAPTQLGATLARFIADADQTADILEGASQRPRSDRLASVEEPLPANTQQTGET